MFKGVYTSECCFNEVFKDISKTSSVPTELLLSIVTGVKMLVKTPSGADVTTAILQSTSDDVMGDVSKPTLRGLSDKWSAPERRSHARTHLVASLRDRSIKVSVTSRWVWTDAAVLLRDRSIKVSVTSQSACGRTQRCLC